MPNPTPESGRRAAGSEGLESLPRLRDDYALLEERWLSYEGKNIARVLTAKVNEMAATEGESARPRLEAEAKTTLKRKMNDLALQFRKTLLNMHAIDATDILHAADEARSRGELQKGHYLIIKRIVDAVRREKAAAETPAGTRTPAELAKEAREREIKEVAWKLFPEGERDPTETMPADFESSKEAKKAIGNFLKEKEKVLKAYVEKRDLEKRKGLLLADIARLKLGRFGAGEDESTIARKEGELIWVENRLNALDLSLDAYNAAKEALKREMLADFIKKKGEYIRKNKKRFIEQNKAEFNRKLGRDPATKLSAAEEKKLLDEILAKEALEWGKRFVLHSIYAIDLKFEQEKGERLTEVREKSRVEKLREAWNRKSKLEKILISTAIAGATGLAIGFAAPSLVGVPLVGWLMAPAAKIGAVGMMGLRAGGALLGAPLGAGFNWLYQKGIGRWFGGKKEKLQQEIEVKAKGAAEDQERETLRRMQEIAEGFGDEKWFKDRETLLQMAKAIDEEADKLRDKMNGMTPEDVRRIQELQSKESKWRGWGAIGMGVLGGLVGSYLFGRYMGPSIGGWLGGGGGGKAVPPAGAAPDYEAQVASHYGEGVPEVGVTPDFEAGRVDAFGDAVPEVAESSGGIGPEAVAGVGKAGAAEALNVPDSIRANPGDTVWETSRVDFAKRYPEFAGLAPQQQDNVLYNFIFKQHSVGDFGLTDFRKMPIGHELNFKNLTQGVNMEELINHARGLKGGVAPVVEAVSVARPVVGFEGGGRIAGSTEFDGVVVEPGEVLRHAGDTFEGVTDKMPETWRGADAAETPIVRRPDMMPQPELPSGGARPGAAPVLAEVAPVPPASEALTPYGTQIEAVVADKVAGLSAKQYEVLQGVTVGKLLKEIPVHDQTELYQGMWKRFSEGTPPDLPHAGKTFWGESVYYSHELNRQTKLAEYVFSQLPITGDTEAVRNLSVREFLQGLGQGATEVVPGGRVIDLNK